MTSVPDPWKVGADGRAGERSAGDPGHRILIGPAVLAASGAFWWAWSGRVGAGVAMVAAAIILFHLLLLSPPARIALQALLDRLGDGVGTVLTIGLLGPVYVLVITPLGLLLRLVGAHPLGAGSVGRSSSTWLVPEGDPATPGSRMYADERSWRPIGFRPADRRRIVVRTAAAILLVEAILVAGWWVYDRRSEPVEQFAGASSLNPADSSALQGQAQLDDLYRDLGGASKNLVYSPFVGSSVRDYESPLVNVERRVRRSYEPPVPAGSDPIDIWFFGGSTMFGFDAQRDLHTIPSEFARLAEADGIPVRVRNYGSPGFVNYQETVLLSLVATAETPPDVVVFYDGINDSSLQILNAVGGINVFGEPADLGAATTRSALFDSGAIPGGSAAPPSPLTSDGAGRPFTAAAIADAVAAVYQQGIDLSTALATQFDFDVVHFWQPDLYTKRSLHPGERALLDDLAFDDFRFEQMRSLSDVIRTEIPPGVIDIADAFDGAEGPIFSDNAHTNEVGAELVATAMYTELAPSLLTASQEG